MTDVLKLSSPATREFWKIPVLFEDEHLLVLDKPSLLLTSPDRYNVERPNLMKLLHRDIERGAPWAKQRRITYLANAHRLDFATSGVILLAKDKPTLIALANQFSAEMRAKIYIALAHGGRPEHKFQVDAKLAPHPVKAGIVRIDEKHGKRSRTDFEVIERFRGYTLLKCQPLTGRTHQIRVHLQSQGLPIVGDAVYGGSPLLLSSLKPDYRFKVKHEERPLIGRVALHAEQLRVNHPVLGTSLAIVAPWPKDLKVAVKYLRKYSTPG
jgi:RluA family pseudouridine synthase